MMLMCDDISWRAEPWRVKMMYLVELVGVATRAAENDAVCVEHHVKLCHVELDGRNGGCRPVERRFAGVLEDDGGGDGDPGALRIAEAPCRGTTCWGEQGEERRSHHGGPRGTREFTGRRIH